MLLAVNSEVMVLNMVGSTSKELLMPNSFPAVFVAVMVDNLLVEPQVAVQKLLLPQLLLKVEL